MFSSEKLTTIETVVNCELKLVSKWLRLNKLSLNAVKSELIFFHSTLGSLIETLPPPPSIFTLIYFPPPPPPAEVI